MVNTKTRARVKLSKSEKPYNLVEHKGQHFFQEGKHGERTPCSDLFKTEKTEKTDRAKSKKNEKPDKDDKGDKEKKEKKKDHAKASKNEKQKDKEKEKKTDKGSRSESRSHGRVSKKPAVTPPKRRCTSKTSPQRAKTSPGKTVPVARLKGMSAKGAGLQTVSNGLFTFGPMLQLLSTSGLEIKTETCRIKCFILNNMCFNVF